jgi:hypothetical protein
MTRIDGILKVKGDPSALVGQLDPVSARTEGSRSEGRRAVCL